MIIGLCGLLLTLAAFGSPQPAPVAAPTPIQTRPPEPTPTLTPSPTPPPQRSSGYVDLGPNFDGADVSARLILDPGSGRSSEAMLIAVTLVNTGKTYFPIASIAPWRLMRLVVTDSAGKATVYQASKAEFEEWTPDIRRRQFHVPPNGELVVEYKGEREFALSHWQIELPPGKYSLQAIPSVGYVQRDETIRSNKVSFTVK